MDESYDNENDMLQLEQQQSEHETQQQMPVIYNNNCLTVIQAAPLVFEEDGVLVPMDATTNHDKERGALQEALADGTVGLDFCDGTLQELEKVGGCCCCLHISCHGQPGYLAFEDKGRMLKVTVEQIIQQIIILATRQNKQQQHKLKLVFLSACHSRPLGQALIQNNGMDHVICCEGRVRDEAAICFTRNLYKALACGHGIASAFELAKEAVGNPDNDVKHATTEMVKFHLLGGKDNQDVVAFQKSGLLQVSTKFAVDRVRINRNKITVPPPPQPFVGRKLELEQIIRALDLNSDSSSRVIQISGPAGVGKLSLALAALKYVGDRSPSYVQVDHYYFVPKNSYNNNDDLISRLFDNLMDVLLHDEDSSFYECCHRLVLDLYDMRALVVLDARRLLKYDAHLERVRALIHQICYKTRHTRILVVCPTGFDISQKLQVDSVVVELESLDIKSSVLLFGSHCRFVEQAYFSCVRSYIDLANVLVPREYQDATIDRRLPRRCRRILELIGGCNPARIGQAARTMSRETYVMLVREGLPHLDDRIKWLNENLQQCRNDGAREQEILFDLTELNELYQTLFRALSSSNAPPPRSSPQVYLIDDIEEGITSTVQAVVADRDDWHDEQEPAALEFPSGLSTHPPIQRRQERITVKEYLERYPLIVYIWVGTLIVAATVVVLGLLWGPAPDWLLHLGLALLGIPVGTGLVALVLHVVDIRRAKGGSCCGKSRNTIDMEAQDNAVVTSHAAPRIPARVQQRQIEVRAWYLLQKEFSSSDRKILFCLPPEELLLKEPKDIDAWLEQVHAAYDSETAPDSISTTDSIRTAHDYSTIGSISSTIGSMSSTTTNNHNDRHNKRRRRAMQVRQWYMVNRRYRQLLRHRGGGGGDEAFSELFCIPLRARLEQEADEIDAWLVQVHLAWNNFRSNTNQ